MRKKGVFLLFVMLVLCSFNVSAKYDFQQVLGNTMSIVQDFVGSGYIRYANAIDFMILFVLFTAVAMMGFGRMTTGNWGATGTTGAVKAMAVSVGLALTFAATQNAKSAIVIREFFYPFARNLIFFAFFLLVYGIYNQMGVQSWFWKAVLAAFTVYLIFAITIGEVDAGFLGGCARSQEAAGSLSAEEMGKVGEWFKTKLPSVKPELFTGQPLLGDTVSKILSAASQEKVHPCLIHGFAMRESGWSKKEGEPHFPGHAYGGPGGTSDMTIVGIAKLYKSKFDALKRQFPEMEDAELAKFAIMAYNAGEGLVATAIRQAAGSDSAKAKGKGITYSNGLFTVTTFKEYTKGKTSGDYSPTWCKQTLDKWTAEGHPLKTHFPNFNTQTTPEQACEMYFKYKLDKEMIGGDGGGYVDSVLKHYQECVDGADVSGGLFLDKVPEGGAEGETKLEKVSPEGDANIKAGESVTFKVKVSGFKAGDKIKWVISTSQANVEKEFDVNKDGEYEYEHKYTKAGEFTASAVLVRDGKEIATKVEWKVKVEDAVSAGGITLTNEGVTYNGKEVTVKAKVKLPEKSKISDHQVQWKVFTPKTDSKAAAEVESLRKAWYVPELELVNQEFTTEHKFTVNDYGKYVVHVYARKKGTTKVDDIADLGIEVEVKTQQQVTSDEIKRIETESAQILENIKGLDKITDPKQKLDKIEELVAALQTLKKSWRLYNVK